MAASHCAIQQKNPQRPAQRNERFSVCLTIGHSRHQRGQRSERKAACMAGSTLIVSCWHCYKLKQLFCATTCTMGVVGGVAPPFVRCLKPCLHDYNLF